jgi:hypothetical protein
LEPNNKAKKGYRQMEMTKKQNVYCYEQRLLSHVRSVKLDIRSVKLVREIGNGTQKRLSEWVF